LFLDKNNIRTNIPIVEHGCISDRGRDKLYEREAIKMSKFYVRWQIDPQMIPSVPEERRKFLLSMLEMVKKDIKAGRVKDWGNVPGESAGYLLVEGASESDLLTSLLKFMPHVNFEVRPVLTVDQTIESYKRMAAAA
jgi:hypothetical protein